MSGLPPSPTHPPPPRVAAQLIKKKKYVYFLSNLYFSPLISRAITDTAPLGSRDSAMQQPHSGHQISIIKTTGLDKYFVLTEAKGGTEARRPGGNSL